MTSGLQEQDAPGLPGPLVSADMRVRFPARVVTADWPATTANREETLDRLTCAPFVSDSAGAQKERVRGLKSLLDWLEDQPGDSWQDLCRGSGTEAKTSIRLPRLARCTSPAWLASTAATASARAESDTAGTGLADWTRNGAPDRQRIFANPRLAGAPLSQPPDTRP
jgi:hypothetical protein